MHLQTPLPPEVWEYTPPEARAYIHALEARAVALEATVQGSQAIVPQLER
jgi:hypothetical protein